MIIPIFAKENEEVDRVHERILRCAGALEELAPLWPEARPVMLRWDLFRNVFVNAQNRSTYPALFGSYWPLRGMNGLWDATGKLLRTASPGRWSRPLQRPLHLPEDAVIFSLRAGNKLVIASARAGRVLKLEHEVRELDNEVRAWTITQKAGIQRHVPRVFGYGTTDDGMAWILSEFVSNKNPLTNPLLPWSNGADRWRAMVRNDILPVLGRFYEASGVALVPVGELLDEQKEQLREQDAPAPLFRLAELAERTGAATAETMAIRADVHGDLHPGNVHCNGAGWKLIDWGSLIRAEVSLDMFKDYFWNFDTSISSNEAFWEWLRGDVTVRQLPDVLGADVEGFIDWQRSEMDLAADARTLRCLLLVHILRRTLERMDNLELRPVLETGHPRALDGFGPLARTLSLRILRQLDALGVLA